MTMATNTNFSKDILDSVKTIYGRALPIFDTVIPATVRLKEISKSNDNASANALAPLTVNNVKGFDLPATGNNGTAAFTIIGAALMAGAAAVIFMVLRKKQGS